MVPPALLRPLRARVVGSKSMLQEEGHCVMLDGRCWSSCVDPREGEEDLMARTYFPLTTPSQRRLLFETWQATGDVEQACRVAHVGRRTFY